MAKKDAYYFSHDSNARNDEKILELRADYDYEGYGVFWAIIEVMREASGYKLSLDKINTLATAINYNCEKLKKLIDDCIKKYGLFKEKDGKYYSLRLLRSMQKRMQLHSKMSANAMQRWSKSNALKERKRKEKKGKERKVLFKNSPYQKPEVFRQAFYENPKYTKYDWEHYYEAVSNWSESKGKMMVDWIATARNWARRDGNKFLNKVDVIRLPDK